MDNQSRLEGLIVRTLSRLTGFIKYNENGLLCFMDQNEHKEISAHYGASHMAASLVIRGNQCDDDEIYSLGKELLESILSRWPEDHKLSAYHYDFNNFAFLLCYDYLKDSDASLKEKIKEIVLKSPDSDHDTINWLPMRLVVNARRMEWSDSPVWKRRIDNCIRTINQATNRDGGIEDRLPKGVSFNLQYDIATLATMIFAKDVYPAYDFDRGLTFLLGCVAPDGDVNYQGRGCNQVFAWGPWIYILSYYGLHSELNKALDYVERRVDNMIEHDSMMLNEWHGSDRFLWWDYHYASVYSAHFLLWILLAAGNRKMTRFEPTTTELDCSTGLRIEKDSDFFAAVFSGRQEYLAEMGPSLNLLWTKSKGMIVKGIFGPWRGLFGNKSVIEDAVMLNYCGLISVKKAFKRSIYSRVIHRFNPLVRSDCSFSKRPLFCPISIGNVNGCLSVTWTNTKLEPVYFNLPSYCLLSDIQLFVDGEVVPMTTIARVRNQYGWVNISQSGCRVGRVWNLIINL